MTCYDSDTRSENIILWLEGYEHHALPLWAISRVVQPLSRWLSSQLVMRIPAQLLFLGSFLNPLLIPITHALHESEVGLVDWHNTQIGVPLTHQGLAPIFHRVDVGRNGSKSVVLSATQSNVLAAIDVVDGSVGTLFDSWVRRGVNGWVYCSVATCIRKR